MASKAAAKALEMLEASLAQESQPGRACLLFPVPNPNITLVANQDDRNRATMFDHISEAVRHATPAASVHERTSQLHSKWIVADTRMLATLRRT